MSKKNPKAKPKRLPGVGSSRIVLRQQPTKRRLVELPQCPNCGAKLHNHGAESHGDGDIYDVLVCEGERDPETGEHSVPCGPVFEWHASYCQCERCGGCGDRLINIYDPENAQYPIPWY